MKSGFSIYLVFIIIAIIINIYKTIQKYKRSQSKRNGAPVNQKTKNTVDEDEREIFKKLQKEILNRIEEVTIEESDEQEYEEDIEKEYNWEENRNYKEIEDTKSMSKSHYEEHKIHSQTEEERLLEMQKSYEERIKQLNSKNYEKIFDRASIARSDVKEFDMPEIGEAKEKTLLNVSLREAIIYNAILERKKINYFKLVQKSSDDKIEKTEKSKIKES